MVLSPDIRRDIEDYVGACLSAPVFFPPFAAAAIPTSLRFRYCAIYVTDTSKPAWMDAGGTWRYADGSAV